MEFFPIQGPKIFKFYKVFPKYLRYVSIVCTLFISNTVKGQYQKNFGQDYVVGAMEDIIHRVAHVSECARMLLLC